MTDTLSSYRDIPRGVEADIDALVRSRETLPKEKIRFVRSQLNEAVIGKPVECGCGNFLPVLLMYRCYYCGEFYCSVCAPGHFGQIREEYELAKIRD